VPEQLDEILLQCLQKRPANRPASAQQLAQRLASVPVAEAWSTERAAAWWRRNLPNAAAAIGS
jgi:serine/threonine-protein kinase